MGDGYRVVFIQGGASTQFATLPMNFLAAGRTADYLVTGSWGEKAIEEATKLGQAKLAGSTKDDNYRRVPAANELSLSAELRPMFT